MDLNILKEYMNEKIKLYINDREIQILEIFDLFHICEIIYIDTDEKTVVDILGITRKKVYNNYISLHRFKGGISN
ncbi:MAG: hypothetical protein K1W33_01765 [Clostridia bacterium]